MARPASALTFHFTPTFCYGLNAGEGFFANLTQSQLKHADIEADKDRLLTGSMPQLACASKVD